jgi:UDP-N-acetylmuramate dehydrogenase
LFYAFSFALWRCVFMGIALQFKSDQPLSEFSTFGIGGPARYFIEIGEIEQMQEAILYCKREKLPYLVIGKGSNTLFDDKGWDGLVILNKIAFCRQEGGSFAVGAGYSFSLLGVQTARKGWSGLEFASGIPGSVGGAVYMNAGASGVETFSVLSQVHYISEEGEVLVFPKEKLEFGYRFSSFQKMKGAIVAAQFILNPSKEARQKQLEIIDYRTSTQPYGEKSAGCVFRNPSTGSAGALIENCGLKGMTVGGAKVSPLHANFIVNFGNASAKDVMELASLIQKTVKEKSGIKLEMEVRYIPHQPHG